MFPFFFKKFQFYFKNFQFFLLKIPIFPQEPLPNFYLSLWSAIFEFAILTKLPNLLQWLIFFSKILSENSYFMKNPSFSSKLSIFLPNSPILERKIAKSNRFQPFCFDILSVALLRKFLDSFDSKFRNLFNITFPNTMGSSNLQKQIPPT